jgi:hypothetical protein
MNGFFLAAVAFALAGILALISGSFWGAQRNAEPGDFGPVVVGLILLVVSEVTAIMLAVIGVVVKAV